MKNKHLPGVRSRTDIRKVFTAEEIENLRPVFFKGHQARGAKLWRRTLEDGIIEVFLEGQIIHFKKLNPELAPF